MQQRITENMSFCILWLACKKKKSLLGGQGKARRTVKHKSLKVQNVPILVCIRYTPKLQTCTVVLNMFINGEMS